MEDHNDVVISQKKENVSILTLNRPKALNAVNAELTSALAYSINGAEEDADVRAILITGTGRAFSAGADLKEIAEKGTIAYSKGGFAGFTRARVKKPMIAAVNGMAYGGGFEIALACDLIVASESASFALPEVKRGILAAAGGLLRLPRQIPEKIALEMILTGETFSAQEMAKWGLVNKVVKSEMLMDVAMNLAKNIASNAPLAVQFSKKVVMESMDVPLTISSAAWEINDQALSRIKETQDAKEGPRAFAEKRDPVWRGE